jgi:hypothetical protein
MPINATYAAFTVSDDVPDGARQAYLPPLAEGEFFQVRGDIDMTEGRGGTRSVGNYLVYQDARRASFGKGAQGSIGEIWIMCPTKPSQIVAVDANGEEIVMAVIPQYRMESIASRLVFAEPISS